ncbi:CPBP family intramembrane glutamic endopeptidase [Pseudonocardia sp. TRM90224]|uniref:CPBP family intramembrane glutamic endopeptidase n=1 Tax=Pseudonocardia sp. TRM90224 TaxID=2812678 RepID=UPI001E3BCF96|nr:CPBP family intramembrane glutamic endopeptidase [Pseudonocardia sp. TRM90224]
MRLAAFVALAFGWSWAWWLPLTMAGRPIGFGEFDLAYVAGIPGPLFAAVVVTAVTDGRTGLRELAGRLSAPLRWCVVAVVAPAALLALVLAGTAIAGVPLPAPSAFGVAPGLPVMPVLLLWIYAVVWNGLGEEVGWRGWLLAQLLGRFRPLPATLIVSLIWAAWHLPLLPVLTSFAVMSHPAMLPVFWFGLACLSVVLTWLYQRSGSVTPAAILHGTYNVAAGTAAAQAGVNVAFTVAIMLVAAWLATRPVDNDEMAVCER